MSLTFSLAHPGLAPQIAEFWRLCFVAIEAYIRFYMERAFRPEQVLVAYSGDRLSAMLTMVPVEATAQGRTLRGRYVFAVATHPDFQGRGISTALLEAAHQHMRTEGVDFSILVPAGDSLFNFYSKRGYTTASYLNIFEPEDGKEEPVVLTAANLEELKPLRDSYFAGSALYCGWTAETLAFLGAECRYHGGEIWAFDYQGRPGYAVCYPHGELIEVKECLPAKAAGALAAALRAQYGLGRCRVRLPARLGEGRPFAMAYWYTPAADIESGGPPYISLVLD